MKKSDLKSGMWVEFRNGEKYLVMTNASTALYGENITVGISKHGFITIDDKYNESLLRSTDDHHFDIVKVYYDSGITRSTYEYPSDTIHWERKEEPKHTELSISEIEEKLQLQSGTLRIKKEPNG